jgi:hypothetical protein
VVNFSIYLAHLILWVWLALHSRILLQFRLRTKYFYFKLSYVFFFWNLAVLSYQFKPFIYNIIMCSNFEHFFFLSKINCKNHCKNILTTFKRYKLNKLSKKSCRTLLPETTVDGKSAYQFETKGLLRLTGTNKMITPSVLTLQFLELLYYTTESESLSRCALHTYALKCTRNDRSYFENFFEQIDYYAERNSYYITALIVFVY